MKKRILIILSVFIISFTFSLLTHFKKVEEQKKVNVVFWTLQMGTFNNYVNGVINSFEKENPNIHIVWVDVPYSEGEKRTLAAILSNNPPDLVNLTPDFSILLAQRKALYPIPKDIMDNYLPSLNSSLNYNNEYFGIPFYATSAITFYNKDLLKKANINKIPKTYDEMYAQAEQIKKLNNVYVTMPTLTENDTILKILNKYNINSPETINSKKCVDIFDQYKYLYTNSLIPKESITQSHREALEKYMAGQIVYLPAGANFLNIIKENSPGIFKNTEITNQLTGTTGKYDFSLMNLVIPKKSKNIEYALKFAIYLTNNENQLELSKLTTILPVNKISLNDKYFTSEEKDNLFSKARITSAKQLDNLQRPIKNTKNQKELLTMSNNYIQRIILGKYVTQEVLNDFSKEWDKINKSSKF